MNQKNYTNTIYKTIYSVLFFASLSIFARAQSSSTNVMSLKGEDFPVEKKLPLFCDTIISCWTIHEGNKKTIFIQLVGMLDNKKTQLQIEVPAKAGTFRIKLDVDGDQKNGEKFYLEIFGKNPPVDNIVYTPEDEHDEATIHIDRFDEQEGNLSGSFSAKFFNGATAVKKVAVTGLFSLDKN